MQWDRDWQQYAADSQLDSDSQGVRYLQEKRRLQQLASKASDGWMTLCNFISGVVSYADQY